MFINEARREKPSASIFRANLNKLLSREHMIDFTMQRKGTFAARRRREGSIRFVDSSLI